MQVAVDPEPSLTLLCDSHHSRAGHISKPLQFEETTDTQRMAGGDDPPAIFRFASEIILQGQLEEAWVRSVIPQECVARNLSAIGAGCLVRWRSP